MYYFFLNQNTCGHCYEFLIIRSTYVLVLYRQAQRVNLVGWSKKYIQALVLRSKTEADNLMVLPVDHF